jgi:hypothetical protein
MYLALSLAYILSSILQSFDASSFISLDLPLTNCEQARLTVIQEGQTILFEQDDFLVERYSDAELQEKASILHLEVEVNCEVYLTMDKQHSLIGEKSESIQNPEIHILISEGRSFALMRVLDNARRLQITPPVSSIPLVSSVLGDNQKVKTHILDSQVQNESIELSSNTDLRISNPIKGSFKLNKNYYTLFLFHSKKNESTKKYGSYVPTANNSEYNLELRVVPISVL